MPGKQYGVSREEIICACLRRGKDYIPPGSKRSVICLETGVVYASQADAARALGLHRETVRDSCKAYKNGQHRRYRCRGACTYHFRFAEHACVDDGQTWKPVQIVGGMFEVSDGGQVRRASTGQLLSCFIGTGGHVFARFCVDQLHSDFDVGRLVAETFLPEHDPDACVVVHIDGDIYNNRLNNLRWATRKEVMNAPETKAKIILANHTSERVLAYRASPKAEAIRQAFKAYGKSNRKQVICEETGIVYASVADAAKATGLKRCVVVGSCKMTESRFSVSEQAGRHILHFRWYNPDDPESYKKRHIATAQDFKDRVAHMRRPVRCLETGTVYESLTAAAEAFGMNTSNLSRMCKHGDPAFACYFRNGKTLYHFRYADEQ